MTANKSTMRRQAVVTPKADEPTVDQRRWREVGRPEREEVSLWVPYNPPNTPLTHPILAHV
jgi:hypothetical protein